MGEREKREKREKRREKREKMLFFRTHTKKTDHAEKRERRK